MGEQKKNQKRNENNSRAKQNKTKLSFPIFILSIATIFFIFGWLFVKMINSKFVQNWVYEVEDKGAGLGTLNFFKNIPDFFVEIVLFLIVFVILVFVLRWVLRKYKH